MHYSTWFPFLHSTSKPEQQYGNRVVVEGRQLSLCVALSLKRLLLDLCATCISSGWPQLIFVVSQRSHKQKHLKFLLGYLAIKLLLGRCCCLFFSLWSLPLFPLPFSPFLFSSVMLFTVSDSEVKQSKALSQVPPAFPAHRKMMVNLWAGGSVVSKCLVPSVWF